MEDKMIFKEGNKVERINGSHMHMEIGDTATVTSLSGTVLYLKEYSGGHSASNFKLEYTSWKDKYKGTK